MAQKFGYDNVEDFKENAQKTFSLAETGILEQESTRLLLVNVSLQHPEYIVLSISLVPLRHPADNSPTNNYCVNRERTTA